MSQNVKNEAEALAVALDFDAIGGAEVTEWADSVIEREEHPHWSICELATMDTRDWADLVRALREVPGTADKRAMQVELVRRLARALAEDHGRADRIAVSLYRLALAGHLPEGEVQSLASWAWDAMHLADQGIADETYEQVVARMLATLLPFAEGARDE